MFEISGDVSSIDGYVKRWIFLEFISKLVQVYTISGMILFSHQIGIKQSTQLWHVVFLVCTRNVKRLGIYIFNGINISCELIVSCEHISLYITELHKNITVRNINCTRVPDVFNEQRQRHFW